MKTTKLIAALLAMGISATALLVSCGDSGEEDTSGIAPAPEQVVEIPTYGITDIMNLEWTAEKETYLSSTKDVEYVGNRTTSNSVFYITREDIEQPSNSTTSEDVSVNKTESVIRVYNMDTDLAVKSFSNSYTRTYNYSTGVRSVVYTQYAIDLISSDYFAVLKTTYEGDGEYDYSSYYSNFFGTMYDLSEVTYLLTIYNANGEQVREITHSEISLRCAKSINNFDEIYAGEGEENCLIYEYIALEEASYSIGGYFFIGNKLYKESEDGSEPTLVKDYGLTKKPDLSSMSKYGDYFLESKREYASSGYAYNYTLYDAELNEVLKYSSPSYATGSSRSKVVFSDGTMLVQYVVSLPEESTNYDFVEGTTKYDLVTISVTKDAVTELSDINYYIVDTIYGNTKIDDQRIYAEGIDVMAYVVNIGADKRMDTNILNANPVVLSSNGKIVANIDLPINAVSIPTRFSDDYFAVSLSDGSVLYYDETGAKVANLSSAASSAKVLGNCFYVSSENAVYTLNGALIRDFDVDYATVPNLGNTIVITNTAVDSTIYSIFLNGEIKEIGAFPIIVESLGSDETAKIKTFNMSSSGYYYIYNPETNKYSYYNEKCELLGEFESILSVVKNTENFILMKYTVETVEETVEPGSTTPTTKIVTTEKLVKLIKSK